MAGKMDSCINSLKNQTFKDFEMIFVDDGSTDSTYEELLEFAKTDDRVSVYQHEKNSSLLAARFTAMKHAKGKYILFLDTDDAITQDACEKIHDSLEKHPVDILRFGFSIEPKGKVMMPEPSEDPLRLIYAYKVPPAIWKNCYSKSVIEATVETGESFYCNMGEDTYLSTVLFTNAHSFDVLNERLLLYDAGTGMSNSNELKPEKIQKAIDSIASSTNHIASYIEKYAKEYEEDSKFAIRVMFRFLIRQHVYLAASDENAERALELFNTPELAEYYNYGKDVVLPTRLKEKQEGTSMTLDFRK